MYTHTHMIGGEVGLHGLLDEAAELGGEGSGHVHQALLHRGHVRHVLGHLLKGVLSGAGQLEGLAGELLVALFEKQRRQCGDVRNEGTQQTHMSF